MDTNDTSADMLSWMLFAIARNRWEKHNISFHKLADVMSHLTWAAYVECVLLNVRHVPKARWDVAVISTFTNLALFAVSKNKTYYYDR